jgi:hypothetical protein
MRSARVRFNTSSNDAMDFQQIVMETYAGKKSTARSVNERNQAALPNDPRWVS